MLHVQRARAGRYNNDIYIAYKRIQYTFRNPEEEE